MRLENWPALLSAYLKESREKEQAWGDHDCIMFSAKCVEAITGINFYSSYPEYKTEEEAKKIINENGGIIKMVSNALGEPHDNYMKAKRGDVVMMCGAIGIVDDTAARIAFVSNKGLSRFPIRKAELVWSY